MASDMKISFRAEAVAAKQQQAFGSIVFIRPISFFYMVVFSTVVVTFFLAMLIFASYTKKNTVSGELVPNFGVVKINAVQKGVVAKRDVSENQKVKKGDVLFVIQDSTYQDGAKNVGSLILHEVQGAIEKINLEISYAETNQLNANASYTAKIESIGFELEQLKNQLSIQKERLALSERSSQEYKQYRASRLITEDQYLQKEIDLLNQREEINAIFQKQISLKRQRTDIEKQMVDGKFNAQTTISKLNRELNETRQKLVEVSAKNNFSIVSPIDGTVSAIVAGEGQSIEVGQILASIVPNDYLLHARLLVPSKAVGFIEKNSPVSLRYQSYPYQNFGQHKGHVNTVSQMPIMVKDARFNFSGQSAAAPYEEPMYLVDVTLNQQELLIKGARRPLKAGMLVEADIQYAKIPLYMWIFEPLLTISKI